MWKSVYETVEFVTFPEVARFQVIKEWKYWSLKKTGMNIRKSLFTQTIPEKNLIKQSKEFAEIGQDQKALTSTSACILAAMTDGWLAAGSVSTQFSGFSKYS